jgi:hypothetical protein
MGQCTPDNVVSLAHRSGREALLLELDVPSIDVFDSKLAGSQTPDAAFDVVLDVARVYGSGVLS